MAGVQRGQLAASVRHVQPPHPPRQAGDRHVGPGQRRPHPGDAGGRRASGDGCGELDTAGDGFFASFDGPARAIRCAEAIIIGISDLGIEIRAGLHAGECERVDGKVAGIAVNIGARVAARAGPGEILVSSSVKDLVAGSGIRFADRGGAELKGIPGDWRLIAVEAPA